MKIDVNNGYNVYRKKLGSDSSVKGAKSESESGAVKSSQDTDILDIARGSTSIADKGMTTLKANLQREINQSASPERLEQLKADIKNGSYKIPTERLVSEILGE